MRKEDKRSGEGVNRRNKIFFELTGKPDLTWFDQTGKSQGNLETATFRLQNQVALENWEDRIVPPALFLPASTALSSTTGTGFRAASTALPGTIGTGRGSLFTALASATGTGFGPASTALARRLFFLGTTCTRFAATSATFPVIGHSVGYKRPSGEQPGDTKPCQEPF